MSMARMHQLEGCAHTIVVEAIRRGVVMVIAKVHIIYRRTIIGEVP
jgi:hypothetical protein